MLELKGVTKVYNTAGLKHKALDNVSINFRTSEFVAVLGPSGSGKTTLLNIVGGLDHYTTGDLRINEVSTKNYRDKDWDAYRNHRIGFVFQSYNLIPHQTVLNNVKLALTLSGISKREANRRAKKALEDVGLKDQINKRPNQLSGGQMQRVAIARALVNNPDILLADEPTGALDSETSLSIMNLLKEIAKDRLVIMVTHNPELAETYATRIVTLKDGRVTDDSNVYDGKIKTDLDTEEAFRKLRKTRMSFLTALLLSLNNLLTKKGRTVLVSIAGSIGIIGIALILAISAGFQTYIDDIQANTLTSYPLTIQKESANVLGVLLNATMGSGKTHDDGKIHEVQILTSMLDSVSTNNLKKFSEYLDNHYGEVKDDLRLVENRYNVDPLIYTIDATGDLARMNPNTLFTNLIGDTSLLNSYSSMTSVYSQMDKSSMEGDMEMLAGRLPEKYNELLVVLADKNEVSDLLTYSLGLHDSDELTAYVTKIMAGESVKVNAEPLKLTYDDLMKVKLKLILQPELYKYNATYDVYEDMSGDKSYMLRLYDEAEELEIVGVATPRDDLLTRTSGVVYLPSLVTHIINETGKTEVVKRQLAKPEIDVLSNKPFGEEGNNFDLAFSDLVKVDESKLAAAIKVNINQDAINAKVAEHLAEINADITTDTTPAHEAVAEKFNELVEGITSEITGTISLSEVNTVVDEFMTRQDLTGLVDKYVTLNAQFSDAYSEILNGVTTAYGGMLKGLLSGYVMAYAAIDPSFTTDPTNPVAIMSPLIFGQVKSAFMGDAKVEAVFQQFATAFTEISMRQKIVTNVLSLVGYISGAMADAFSVDSEALIGAFSLKFSEEELTRVVNTLFSRNETTLATNLAKLGYQDLDDPTYISFYFNSFEGKTDFMKFIDHYNELMEGYGMKDDAIEYADTTGLLMSSVKSIVDAVSYVLIAFVSISLVVSSIMIGIITYISVYERTKEIGILRAIGASKHNISSIFNAETFIVGLLAGLFGIGFSYLVIPIINLVMGSFTKDIPGELSAFLAPGAAVVLVVLSVVLTLIGGIIPARAAAKKDPVEALRSE